MGGGKGGGSTTQNFSTGSSTVSIPPEVLARYNQVNEQAQTAAGNPFQSYPGQFVAPVNPTQQGGINNITGAAGSWDPYIAAGAGALGGGLGAANSAIGGGLSAGYGGVNAGYGAIGQGLNTGTGLGMQSLGLASGAGANASPFNTGAANYFGGGLGAAQPFNSSAGNYFGSAFGNAQPFNTSAAGLSLAGTGQVNPNALDISQYLSPYNQQVIDATSAQMKNLFGQQQRDLTGNQILSGSFGSDRGGIGKATLGNQQDLAYGQTIGGLYNQNYAQALAAAQQQQGVGLGAAQANRAALQQGAGQMLGIGNTIFGQGIGAGQAQQGLGQQVFGQNYQTGQGMLGVGNQIFGQGMGVAGQYGNIGGQLGQLGLGAGQAYGQLGLGAGNLGVGAGQAYGNLGLGAAGAYSGLGTSQLQNQLGQGQAQLAAGMVPQQTSQALNTAQYNQFLQQQGYPFQVAQFLAGIAEGTGALSGSTTNSTGSSSGYSYQPQPFFSDERLKEDVRHIATTKDGIKVVSFKYKGSPHTQIGMLAQDVEKKRPDAVGSHGGYKTVDYDAATRSKYNNGGLVPRGAFAYGGEPNSFDDMLRLHQAMYPGSLNAMGIGAGPRGMQLQPAGGHQMIKGPEVKLAEAKFPKAPETTGLKSAATDINTLATSASNVGSSYREASDALVGTAPVGKPGDANYKPGTGGLFGDQGSRSNPGWVDRQIDSIRGSSSASTVPNGGSVTTTPSTVPNGGSVTTTPSTVPNGGSVTTTPLAPPVRTASGVAPPPADVPTPATQTVDASGLMPAADTSSSMLADASNTTSIDDLLMMAARGGRIRKAIGGGLPYEDSYVPTDNSSPSLTQLMGEQRGMEGNAYPPPGFGGGPPMGGGGGGGNPLSMLSSGLGMANMTKGLGGMFGGSSGGAGGLGGAGVATDAGSWGAGAATDAGAWGSAGAGAADLASISFTDALETAVLFAKRGGRILRADGGHTNSWMEIPGSIIGAGIGGFYGGPLGAMAGSKAGGNAGDIIGDATGGNWQAVGGDIEKGLMPAFPPGMMHTGGRVGYAGGGGDSEDVDVAELPAQPKAEGLAPAEIPRTPLGRTPTPIQHRSREAPHGSAPSSRGLPEPVAEGLKPSQPLPDEPLDFPKPVPAPAQATGLKPAPAVASRTPPPVVQAPVPVPAPVQAPAQAPAQTPTQRPPVGPSTGQAPAQAGSRQDMLDRSMAAVGTIESSSGGDLTKGWGTVGPETKYQDGRVDRPYGKFGVMGANVPEWTKQWYGQALTPQQFLGNADAQTAVFKGQFGSYIDKFGTPERASAAWFAGPNGLNSNAKDVLGTSVPAYYRGFTALYNGQPDPGGRSGRSDVALNAPAGSAPTPPGMGPGNMGAPPYNLWTGKPDRRPNKDEGFFEENGWLDRNQREVASGLSFLGNMLGSERRTLAGSVGQGLAAAAPFWMNTGLRQQEMGQRQTGIGQEQERINIAQVGQLQSLWTDLNARIASMTGVPGTDPKVLASMRAQADQIRQRLMQVSGMDPAQQAAVDKAIHTATNVQPLPPPATGTTTAPAAPPATSASPTAPPNAPPEAELKWWPKDKARTWVPTASPVNIADYEAKMNPMNRPSYLRYLAAQVAGADPALKQKYLNDATAAEERFKSGEYIDADVRVQRVPGFAASKQIEANIGDNAEYRRREGAAQQGRQNEIFNYQDLSRLFQTYESGALAGDINSLTKLGERFGIKGLDNMQPADADAAIKNALDASFNSLQRAGGAPSDSRFEGAQHVQPGIGMNAKANRHVLAMRIAGIEQKNAMYDEYLAELDNHPDLNRQRFEKEWLKGHPLEDDVHRHEKEIAVRGGTPTFRKEETNPDGTKHHVTVPDPREMEINQKYVIDPIPGDPRFANGKAKVLRFVGVDGNGGPLWSTK